ncbi:nucleosidase [Streptomyces sp. NPDC059378]|uniref:5'-methylthioadenosine/S-adenosylhomocysteine nucleosidase family protein n=1 Tax=Streptomyces sp. NPDC059378 TaxID=3346815 RepID=UPI0036AFE1CE
MAHEHRRPTAVILTALPLEYEAVRARLTDVRRREAPSGTRFDTGSLPGTPWEVAVAEIGMGSETAAVITNEAHSWLKPEVLLFVGVAGSLKDDVRIGDVVVATKVYAYHGGKQTPDGFLARPGAWPASHRLLQAARAALRRGTGWHDPEPPVHFAPVAAGDVVLADAGSELTAFLKRTFNDAAAIEMEAAGVAQAAQLTGTLQALVIRGISDLADGNKGAADAAGSQPRAATHAATAAAATLAELMPGDGTGTADSSEGSRPSPQYGGDHIDFRGGVFFGPVTGKIVGKE